MRFAAVLVLAASGSLPKVGEAFKRLPNDLPGHRSRLASEGNGVEFLSPKSQERGRLGVAVLPEVELGSTGGIG